MQIWNMLSLGKSQPESAIVEALDRHARLTLSGDMAGAAIFRQQQDPDTADLMLLAEQLSYALRAVSLSEAAMDWLRELVLGEEPLSRRRRLVGAVRDHGREAVLGAALVGTAVSIGAVAWRFR
ncbi:MAG: hypothetical protein ACYC5O_23885, partial [Anaerolineae bacterium]